MQVTKSRLKYPQEADSHDAALLRRWCEKAASLGGSFAIETVWGGDNWWIDYTICWPGKPAALDPAGGE